MLVSDFYFHLPEDLIAQEPLADRSSSRLLQVDRASDDRATGQLQDRRFRDFPSFLRPGDLLVLNNTKVFPARLLGRRAGVKSQPLSSQNPAARDFLRGRIEVLLTRQCGGVLHSRKNNEEQNDWECLVRPGRKIQVGERVFFGENDELQAEVIARGAFGERTIRFQTVDHDDFFTVLARIGHVPLPPYIARPDSSADRDRYQTIYARERGSVAAPTAGLHFTPEILAQIADCGVETTEITLHVGLGTFQPVRVEKVEEHSLHREAYTISPAGAQKINRALEESRRVIAVGTTTVRTLEYAARQGEGSISAGSGEADIFIYPGYEFRVVNGLLTNFHLPQSTLLMLVCAFGGRDNVLRAYNHAVAQRYRFYSYGDCMFLA